MDAVSRQRLGRGPECTQHCGGAATIEMRAGGRRSHEMKKVRRTILMFVVEVKGDGGGSEIEQRLGKGGAPAAARGIEEIPRRVACGECLCHRPQRRYADSPGNQPNMRCPVD